MDAAWVGSLRKAHGAYFGIGRRADLAPRLLSHASVRTGLADAAHLRTLVLGMRLEPVFKFPTAWTGEYRHVGVHLFHGRVTVAEMDRMDAIGTEWRRRHPGKLVELVVIHPTDVQMTGEERTRMTKLIKRWEHDRIASATVILADGLMGSLQRSVLTGLTMLAPPPHPAKVFGSVASCVEWLAPHVTTLWKQPASGAELFSAIETFRSEFLARPVQATAAP